MRIIEGRLPSAWSFFALLAGFFQFFCPVLCRKTCFRLHLREIFAQVACLFVCGLRAKNVIAKSAYFSLSEHMACGGIYRSARLGFLSGFRVADVVWNFYFSRGFSAHFISLEVAQKSVQTKFYHRLHLTLCMRRFFV